MFLMLRRRRLLFSCEMASASASASRCCMSDLVAKLVLCRYLSSTLYYYCYFLCTDRLLRFSTYCCLFCRVRCSVRLVCRDVCLLRVCVLIRVLICWMLLLCSLFRFIGVVSLRRSSYSCACFCTNFFLVVVLFLSLFCCVTHNVLIRYIAMLKSQSINLAT